MSRTKHSIKNSFWGVCYRVMHMIVPVFVRAIIIHNIGAAYVGLNGLFKSILSVLNLSELGFGSAVVYLMYKPIAEGDKQTIRSLMTLLRRVYRWVGMIMLVMGLAAVPFLQFLVKNDTGTDVNIYLLYGMYLFHTVMSYLMFSYRSALFTAHQESDVNFKIMCFCGVMEYALQIFVLFTTRNYYLYLLVFALMIIPQNLLYLYFSKRKYPDLYPEGEPSPEHIRTIMTKVKSLIGHRIGGTVLISIDDVLISAFLGVTLLTKYDNYYFIMSSVVSMINVFRTSILASVGNKLHTDTLENVYDLLKRLIFLWIGLIGWCTAFFLALYQPFIRIWVGQNFLFENSIVVVFGFYFFFWQFRQVGTVMKDAAGLWEEDKLKPYIGMLLNLVLSIICIKITGSVVGVLVPTMAILLFIYFPWETHVVFNTLLKRSSAEYYMLNIRFMVTILFAAFLNGFICGLIPLHGLAAVIVRGVVTCVIPPAVYVALNYNTRQCKAAVALFFRILGRGKKA